MKTMNCKSWGGRVIVISLLVVSVALPATVVAQSKSGAQADVRVLAQLPLPGIHVNGMFVQHRDGKDYLYLHRPTRQAFALVDVSKPEKPVLLERATMAETSQARVDVLPSNPSLAIAVAAEEHPAAGPAKSNPAGDPPKAVTLPTETIRVMDLSDPQHPRVLKTFEGVTSFLPDDSRRLIYIVNAEGLTIVRHGQTRPMPLCTSEDAMNQAANCQ